MASEEMKYEVHTADGKTWYCSELGYANQLLDTVPSFIDGEIDMVMLNAIEKCYIDCSNKPYDVVFLTYSPVTVAVLEKTVISRWHRSQMDKLVTFP